MAIKSSSDFLIYLLMRIFVSLVGGAPFRFSRWVCRTLALIVYYLDRKHRRIGLLNLAIAFPEKPESWRREVLRESFGQIGEHAVEVCRLARMGPEEIEERVRYQEGFGLEHYWAAKRQGRGLIFLTAHVCAWELLPAAHAVLGHPLSFVVRPLENRYLDEWSTQIRSRFGNRVLSKFGSLRQILRILQSNEDVGILIDQNVQEKDGVYAELFGQPAATTSTAAALAIKTGAPVVAGFLLPDPVPGHYRIRFYPPFKAEVTGDRERDLVANTTRFNRYVEEVIREFPQCWLWGHRRFATRPDGRNIYAD